MFGVVMFAIILGLCALMQNPPKNRNKREAWKYEVQQNQINYKYYKKENLHNRINDLLKKNELYILCESKQEALELLSYLELQGFDWKRCSRKNICNDPITKSYYLSENLNWRYKKHTCYQLFSNGDVGIRHLGWCAENNYPIVYAKDFMKVTK